VVVITHKVQNYMGLEIFDIFIHEECDSIIKITRQKGLEYSVVLSYNDDKTTLILIIEKVNKHGK